uniref:Uncharacterized protein n=1 Tax=Leersia perrieri TaxID=77586 RepID=A0A0D9WHX6_9ORYZ
MGGGRSRSESTQWCQIKHASLNRKAVDANLFQSIYVPSKFSSCWLVKITVVYFASPFMHVRKLLYSNANSHEKLERVV